MPSSVSSAREIPIWRILPEDQGPTGRESRALARSLDVNGNGKVSLQELWGGSSFVPAKPDANSERALVHLGIVEAQGRGVFGDLARVAQGRVFHAVWSQFSGE